MSAADRDLPAVLAPPLAPDASFDAEVAAAFGATFLAKARRRRVEPPRKAA